MQKDFHHGYMSDRIVEKNHLTQPRPVHTIHRAERPPRITATVPTSGQIARQSRRPRSPDGRALERGERLFAGEPVHGDEVAAQVGHPAQTDAAQPAQCGAAVRPPVLVQRRGIGVDATAERAGVPAADAADCKQNRAPQTGRAVSTEQSAVNRQQVADSGQRTARGSEASSVAERRSTADAATTETEPARPDGRREITGMEAAQGPKECERRV